MSSANDYGDTSATTPDPEGVAEGDTNQLQQDDTLLDRGVDSILDEGIVTAEKPPGGRLETHLEQILGESLDDRLAQEEPEIWDLEPGEPVPGASDPTRAGRLAADAADVDGTYTSSTMAVDAGIAGGAATAEEAAMHVIEEDETF